MKTSEEIKKGLECCIIDDCNGCPYEDNCFSVDEELCATMNTDALACIQQLEAAQPKWISVEERLPDVCDLVLVIANGKPEEHIELCDAVLIASYWGDGGWIADGFDGWDNLKVSHWMPLPEPPRKEK